jgi:hypothetical protein
MTAVKFDASVNLEILWNGVMALRKSVLQKTW